ncbi:hypothetical protein P3602_06585 [Vibrio parahaemolyticus]|uniref:hypothetical protein n=1 Tax=Vibrio parahaemolyticus TaxID=670 RepID=UPI001B8217A7|nr:hypothetical protein [Vibrio parahaemolyticus]MBE3746753.1 hypothetical protein [Vibrio parahaemolyticus]MDF4369949.1 hypothetical protein [Vibrio parahaemolyticus]MDF4512148.1 hypothetical protein [Vibrio parahaemolyticus]MDF4770867.1 hypothetical protein [Vibrio parahaemolyticus]MDF5053676.1 hypothetical protein [Vibrio parahaemolyticus]
MKALMGKLASRIRRDNKGREELRKVIASQLDNQEITLSDGTKYIISRTNPKTSDSRQHAEPA